MRGALIGGEGFEMFALMRKRRAKFGVSRRVVGMLQKILFPQSNRRSVTGELPQTFSSAAQVVGVERVNGGGAGECGLRWIESSEQNIGFA